MVEKSVTIYTLSAHDDLLQQPLLKRAKTILSNYKLNWQHVTALSVWQQKKLHSQTRGNLAYPLFVIGSNYLCGIQALESFLNANPPFSCSAPSLALDDSRSDPQLPLFRESQSEKKPNFSFYKVDLNPISSSSPVYEQPFDLDEQFRMDLQKLADEPDPSPPDQSNPMLLKLPPSPWFYTSPSSISSPLPVAWPIEEQSCPLFKPEEWTQSNQIHPSWKESASSSSWDAGHPSIYHQKSPEDYYSHFYKEGTDLSEMGTDPSGMGTDPNKMGTNPTQIRTNPTQIRTSPTQIPSQMFDIVNLEHSIPPIESITSLSYSTSPNQSFSDTIHLPPSPSFELCQLPINALLPHPSNPIASGSISTHISDIFEQLKRISPFDPHDLNRKFNKFDKLTFQIELATKGAAHYLSRPDPIQSLKYNHSSTLSTTKSDRTQWPNQIPQDTDYSFTFPVIHKNWYWRQQKRYIRLKLDHLARLEPDQWQVRDRIPYAKIKTILLKKDGEFLIRYGDDRFSGYQEMVCIMTSDRLASKIGEAIQSIESIRNHIITLTYIAQ